MDSKSNNSMISIYPTDTVWGIASGVEQHFGAKEILKIKKTKEDRPFSIMYSSLKELCQSLQFEENLFWQNFFQLESTLLVPAHLILTNGKYKIDEIFWSKTGHLSVRVLNNYLIQQIFEFYGGPFISTSLNLSGEAPITNEDDALLFKNQHCPNAQFFSSTWIPSGASSTIIKWISSKEFQIIRSGRKVGEIEALILSSGGSVYKAK